MDLLAAPILLIVVVLYVAWPLLADDEASPDFVLDRGELEAARIEKNNLVESLKDLEMDFQMGKLSEADYESLTGHLESEAVRALRRLEELDIEANPPSADPGS